MKFFWHSLREFISNKIKSIKNYLKSPNSFWVIFISIFGLVFLCFIDLHLPKIIILEKPDAINLLNNRISEFINLFSISISVFAILISFIQFNKHGENVLTTIFKESYIYPILWFSLSSISGLFIISFFQKTEKIISNEVFIRILVLGGYLFLIDVLLIGLLFYRVFLFLKTDILFDKYLEELVSLAHKEKKGRVIETIDKDKQRIEDRLEKACYENDRITVDKIIKTYKEIFETYSNSRIVVNINHKIYKSIEKLIQSNNIDGIYNFIRFWHTLVIFSFQNKNKASVEALIFLPRDIYQLLVINNFKQINGITQNLGLRLKECNYSIINYGESTDIELIKSYNEYFYYLAYSFNELEKIIIDYNDRENLVHIKNHRKLLKPIKNDVFELKLKLRNLIKENKNESINSEIKRIKDEIKIRGHSNNILRITEFGLFCWFCYSYQINKSDKNIYEILFNVLKIPRYDFSDKITLLVECIQNERLFGWENWIWGSQERLDGKVYTTESMSDILSIGFIISNINTTISVHSGFFDDADFLNNIEYLPYYMKTNTGFLLNYKQKWSEFLNVTETHFEQQLQKINAFFDEIAKKSLGNKNREIALQSLSSDKINEFKSNVIQEWENGLHFKELFEYFENYQIIEDKEIKLKLLGDSNNILGGKMMFVDKHFQTIYGLGYGNLVKSYIEDYFFELLQEYSSKKNYPEVKEYENIIYAIQDVSKILLERGFEANFLTLHHSTRYSQLLNQDNKFKSNYNSEFKDIPFVFDGFYDKIMILPISNRWLEEDEVLICNFGQAFEMLQRKNKDWHNEILKIEVQDLNEDEAQEFYEKNKDLYQTLTLEEAIIKIRNNVKIQVYETLDFRIKNENAFEIVKVKMF
jgi:hypothetical protein